MYADVKIFVINGKATIYGNLYNSFGVSCFIIHLFGMNLVHILYNLKAEKEAKEHKKILVNIFLAVSSYPRGWV